MMVWYLTLWVQNTLQHICHLWSLFDCLSDGTEIVKQVLLTYLMETIITVFLLLSPNCIKLKAEILNIFIDLVVNLTQEKMKLKD